MSPPLSSVHMSDPALKWIAGGVTAARGFRAAGVSAGIKRSRKPDLSLVVSDEPATAVGVFTRNRVKAAPVLISQHRLRSGQAQAIVLNSGCANCLTGAQGVQDAVTLSRDVARLLGIQERQVLVASTGVIGRRLPVPRIQRVLPTLVERLSRQGHRQAALGILTTDLMAKEVAVAQTIAGRTMRLGGMAKGAGMIAPSMATMLCVLTTDAQIDRTLAKRLLREAVDRSFNRISIDGDMSTNDSVLLFASGRSGVGVRPGGLAARSFAAMLDAVTQRLAYLLVKDGEGSTRVAAIHVQGACSLADAEACARQVATSSLVRTMLASGDPNVGRIAAAAGASGARFVPDRLEIRISGYPVVQHGVARKLGKTLARRLFAPRDPRIEILLHAGTASAEMLACDLTEEYVRMNAHYST